MRRRAEVGNLSSGARLRMAAPAQQLPLRIVWRDRTLAGSIAAGMDRDAHRPPRTARCARATADDMDLCGVKRPGFFSAARGRCP
ncbi:hypothetical protein NCCP691_36930 [Noviherbaspirillum aridicola]|uniref:Uncharacterized protein n=1 Tax=Noviherbaspirillum aridicola TaxID=2849687 RepID=A0ABQ4Q9D9_9BURK|nr:hypothetical protein NCCP691_36930 [Noviherbaspirillum aridicola]